MVRLATTIYLVVKLCKCKILKLKDQIRNKVIINEQNILNLNKIVHNNRINWIPHVKRLKPERIPRYLMEYTPTGTRSAGLPKLYRKDQSIL
jgi:hypothetical protein